MQIDWTRVSKKFTTSPYFIAGCSAVYYLDEAEAGWSRQDEYRNNRLCRNVQLHSISARTQQYNSFYLHLDISPHILYIYTSCL